MSERLIDDKVQLCNSIVSRLKGHEMSRRLRPRPRKLHSAIAPLFGAFALSLSIGAHACEPDVRWALDKMDALQEPKDAQNGKFGSSQTYFVDALAYWYARAGCPAPANEIHTTSKFDATRLYALAGAIVGSKQISAESYAAVMDNGSEEINGLLIPVLARPENGRFLIRYLSGPGAPKNDRLRRVFKYLHGQRRYAEVIQLMEQFGPLASDDWTQLQISGAYLATGQLERAKALAEPTLKFYPGRLAFASALARFGNVAEAWVLVDTWPGPGQPKMIFEVLEGSADLRGGQERHAALKPCDRAWLAAMGRQYLEAIRLADLARCEARSPVQPIQADRLVQRYEAAKLYEIAAKHRDELLFDHLAGKAGAHDGLHSSAMWPMVLSLVARGRSDLGLMLFDENVMGTRAHSGRWSQLSALAGSEFDFDVWLSLYFQSITSDPSFGALTDMANAYSLRSPAEASAWYAAHETTMAAAQSGAFAYGIVLGRLGIPVNYQDDETDSAKRPGPLYTRTDR